MKKLRNLGTILLAATALAVLSGCGGPQSSPENVARAFVEAVVDGDCDAADTYTSPDLRPSDYCLHREITYARIDEVIVRETSHSRAIATLLGSFTLETGGLFGGTYTRDRLSFRLEILDGKWYVLRRTEMTW